MMDWLYTLPLAGLFVVILIPCVLFALLAVAITRALGWVISGDEAGSAGVMHGFVSLVYAVVLGLMVAAVQEDYSQVEAASADEASQVSDFYRTLAGMSPEPRARFQNQARQYIDLVIDREWPAEGRGERSEETWAAMDRLTYELVSYHPQDEHEAVVYEQLLANLSSILDARRLRLHIGQVDEGPVVWLVILAGAIISIGFISVFPMNQLRMQLTLTSVMATMFGLMIFLIVAMDRPLRGRLAVGPEAFVTVRANLDRVDREGFGRLAPDSTAER